MRRWQKKSQQIKPKLSCKVRNGTKSHFSFLFKYPCISSQPRNPHLTLQTPRFPLNMQAAGGWDSSCFEVLQSAVLPLTASASEGHIMALRRPGFLHNDGFLWSCPVLAGWMCGWRAGWLATWQADQCSACVCSICNKKTALSSARIYPFTCRLS